MKVKFKKLTENAITPTYANPGDAGLDIYATSVDTTNYRYIEYGTGLSFELPKGYVMLIFPRSSISNKTLSLTNCVGVLDSGYRGELKFRFRISPYPHPKCKECNIYKVGDKIGQVIIIPYPTIELEETNSLSESERGENGFGSSGN